MLEGSDLLWPNDTTDPNLTKLICGLFVKEKIFEIIHDSQLVCFAAFFRTGYHLILKFLSLFCRLCAGCHRRLMNILLASRRTNGVKTLTVFRPTTFIGHIVGRREA